MAKLANSVRHPVAVACSGDLAQAAYHKSSFQGAAAIGVACAMEENGIETPLDEFSDHVRDGLARTNKFEKH